MKERDRLMTLREKFNIPGRIITCETDNYPSLGNDENQDRTFTGKSEISESDIKRITQEIISKLNLE